MAVVDGTSIKMDFLPIGSARIDPLLNPTCLSDHVHTFYGAKASLRPETTYEDMRNASENSGNTEENMSLYWHPTVYMHDKVRGVYKMADIWFASSYYVWQTGQATAFPNGFNMIAYGSHPKARSEAICDGPSPCERDDCSSADDSFFPSTACAELEAKLVFPTCWDGVNIRSDNMMDHVSYDIEEGRFDADCPASHPVKLPEVHFYFRIKDYQGGEYVFSDGSSTYHSDYFSGWDAVQLQRILDGCSNPSDAAMPDQFCETHLTFRQPKVSGVSTEDDDIRAKLEEIHTVPNPDLRAIVSAEAIDTIAAFPRGACTGSLIPLDHVATPLATPLTGRQQADGGNASSAHSVGRQPADSDTASSAPRVHGVPVPTLLVVSAALASGLRSL